MYIAEGYIKHVRVRSPLVWLKTYLQFRVLPSKASLLASVKSNDDNKYEAKLFRLLSNASLTRGVRARALQLLTSIKFPKLGEGKGEF